MGLKVCTIVKNEALRLPGFLGALDGMVDEVCCIDTGSTDGTQEVLKTFERGRGGQAPVRWAPSRHFTAATPVGQFRFNVAKNEAIDLAANVRGNWLLILDADEKPRPGALAAIRELIGRQEPPAVYGLRTHYGPMTFDRAQLFPGGFGVGFNAEMSCHEFLETQGLPVLTRPEIGIEHAVENRPSRLTRNIAILEADYFGRGYSSPRHLFYLANAYREAGRFVQARQFYGQYLAVGDWPEQRYWAYVYLGRCLAAAREYGRARAAGLSAAAECTDGAEAYCLLGDVARAAGRRGEACCWYQHALAVGAPADDRKLFVEAAAYRDYPLSKLVEIQQGAAPEKKKRGKK